jgi:hypothetical protein
MFSELDTKYLVLFVLSADVQEFRSCQFFSDQLRTVTSHVDHDDGDRSSLRNVSFKPSHEAAEGPKKIFNVLSYLSSTATLGMQENVVPYRLT